MLTVYVKYYSNLASITGKDTETFSLPDGTTVYDLLMEIFSKYRAFANVELFLATHNEVFVPVSEYQNTLLADQDWVGFFPPAQGG